MIEFSKRALLIEPSGRLARTLHVLARSRRVQVALLLPALVSVGLVAQGDPGPRYGHVMAFDEMRGVTVLQGGYDPGGVGGLSDTWEWNGAVWTSRQSLSHRREHAMVYDRHNAECVVFGGDPGPVSSLFVWDGATWSQPPISSGPSARYHHAMAYDGQRRVVVMFGGIGSGGHLSDTWEWNGTTWGSLSNTGPSARSEHAMAYNVQSGRTVLVGGRNANLHFYSDTWEWDGTTWAGPAAGPGPRGTHAMVYDSQRSRLVVFGGNYNTVGGLYGDTWERIGGTWTQVSTNGPTPRHTPKMAYDNQRGRTVLFGGQSAAGNQNDTWEWDGTTWRTPSFIQGTVKIGGLLASNVPVEFVASTTTYGPAYSDSVGNFLLSQVPLGSQGRVRATVDGLHFFHTPQPLSQLAQLGDLDVTVSSNLTGVDVEVPRPVMLVHGFNAHQLLPLVGIGGPGRWSGTESRMNMNLVARLSAGGLAPRQARITRALLSEVNPYQFTIGYDAQLIDQQITAFRSSLLAGHGVSNVQLDMVAHSKGGLVARSYLHHHAGQGKVRTLVTLGSPHGGFLPFMGGLPLSPTNAVNEMHPLNMWGVDLLGNPAPGSFGQVVTDLKGARLCVVGCDEYDHAFFALRGGLYMWAWEQASLLPTGYWNSYSQTLTFSWLHGFGALGDNFIDSWSSVAYPSDHAPFAVYNADYVADSHGEIPSDNTTESVILPWLDTP